MMAVVFALPIILIFLLIITGIISLIFAKNRWRFIIVAVFVLLLLGFAFIGFNTRSFQKIEVIGNADNFRLSSKTEIAQIPIDNPPVWQPGIEDQFIADVYPSRQSAVRAIGRRTKDYADVKINTVDVKTHPTPWATDTEAKLNSGTVEAAVVGDANQQAAISADFVEKPWVDNLADFINQKPNHNWILARSQTSCTSVGEAEEQAMNDACDKISRILNQNLQASHRAALKVAPEDIQRWKLVVDRFVQSFTGTTGSIWREALLLDASTDKLASLSRSKTTASRMQRSSWMREIFSVTGVLVLICVLYLFLDAATRGYYTWALRIATIVVILAGILLIRIIRGI